MSTTTKIVVIEDHDMMRFGLTQLIRTDSALTVAGTAGNGMQGLGLLRQNTTDLVLLDLTLPDCHGLSLIRQIKQRFSKIRILVLSMHDEFRYAERALAAGASGYITKTSSPEKVLEAIHKVVSGGIYVSEEFKERMLESSNGTRCRPSQSPLELLSNRELEVLRLIGSGLGSSEVAMQLQRSIKTVEAHRANIMHKLDLSSFAELVHYAIRTGIVEP